MKVRGQAVTANNQDEESFIESEKSVMCAWCHHHLCLFETCGATGTVDVFAILLPGDAKRLLGVPMFDFHNSPESWYVGYIFGEERMVTRVVGSAAFAAVVLPRCHTFLLRHFSMQLMKFRNRPLLLPIHRLSCTALGMVGGMLEHYAAGVAYVDTAQCRRPIQVPLWTFRSLLPACLFFVHPFFAMRILTGEMKGSDVAMAEIERRPFRRWPFFSVYDSKSAGFWTYGTQRFLLDGFYPSQPS